MPEYKRSIELYDTTLRDGTQALGFILTVEDKLRVAAKLDELGVAYIEGGWPGANPKDSEFFERAKQMELKNSVLTAFGSTHHPSRTPENDANLAAMLDSGCKAVTLVGKAWNRHVITQLKVELPRNLELIENSIAYLIKNGREAILDAEHFFDGFKEDSEYTLSCLRAAANGGAATLVLCDTNGGCLTSEVSEIVRRVVSEFPEQKIGIHCHNDSELAVANSLAAIEAGAHQAQGTMGGMGERCGNANLCSIAPALQAKMGLQCLPEGHLEKLTTTSRFVLELANMPPARYAPYVGESAFSHKGGLHISAVERDPALYEHMDPILVGNNRRYLLSEQAGRAAVVSKAKDWGIDLGENQEHAAKMLATIKERENDGYVYEVAEGSLEMLMREETGQSLDYFKLMNYRVQDYKDSRDTAPVSEATVMILVNDRVMHTAAVGNGPVHALDRAIRKALMGYFPQLKDMRLSDYKVRVLTGKKGTAARVRVLVESSDEASSWGTVGVSFDVMEASWQALRDAIRYKLFKSGLKV